MTTLGGRKFHRLLGAAGFWQRLVMTELPRTTMKTQLWAK
jgi:hypothetical protein